MIYDIVNCDCVHPPHTDHTHSSSRSEKPGSDRLQTHLQAGPHPRLAPQNAADVTGVPLMSPCLHPSDIKGEESRAQKLTPLLSRTECPDVVGGGVTYHMCGPDWRNTLLAGLLAGFLIVEGRRLCTISWSHKMLVWTQTKVGRNIIAGGGDVWCGVAASGAQLAVSELQWLGPPPQHQPITARQAEKIFCILCPEGQTCKPCLTRFGRAQYADKFTTLAFWLQKVLPHLCLLQC